MPPKCYATVVDSVDAPVASPEYVVTRLSGDMIRRSVSQCALYPPLTTCERILRYTLKLWSMGKRPIDLRTVADGTEMTIAEVACSLANPTFVDLATTGCGCYTKLTPPRVGSLVTRISVKPVPKKNLIGSILTADATGRWTVAVTGKLVVWADGHVALPADGRVTRVGEEGSRPVNGRGGDEV